MRDLSAQLELEGILDARHKASILVQLQAHTQLATLFAFASSRRM